MIDATPPPTLCTLKVIGQKEAIGPGPLHPYATICCVLLLMCWGQAVFCLPSVRHGKHTPDFKNTTHGRLTSRPQGHTAFLVLFHSDYAWPQASLGRESGPPV